MLRWCGLCLAGGEFLSIRRYGIEPSAFSACHEIIMCFLFLINLFIYIESFVAQVGLEQVGSSDLPALAPQIPETTGICHHTQLNDTVLDTL